MNSDHPSILYLSYDGLTDPLGQSQILPYLCGLASKGYKITIVSFEKVERFENERNGIKKLCESNQLRWVPLCYHKNPPIFSTLYDLFVMKKTAHRILKKEKISIVHCRSYITSLVGMRLKKKYGLKFVFDMRGFWADERVEGGIWKLSNPLLNRIYRYFKKKEKEFLLGADHIISLTQNAKKEIESWGIKTPITVIPTCVDLDLFDPEKVTPDAIKELKMAFGIKKDDFVLLYVGSWGTWYLTREMLCFFSIIRKKVQAKFLIVSRDNVNLKDYEFADDTIVRSVKHDEIPLHISLASLAIAFIKPSFSKKASSATKIGEFMAMGTYILTNAGWGDVEQLVSRNLLILNDFSPESMNVAAHNILQLKGSLQRTDMRTHSLALSSGILNYHNIYDGII